MEKRIRSTVHIAFLLRLINKEGLMDWAFKRIENDGYSDFFGSIIDCKSDVDILYALGPIDNEEENIAFYLEFFLGLLNKLMNVVLWEVVQEKIVKLSKLLDLTAISDSTNLYLTQISDDYALRNEGFSGSMNMPQDLSDFLHNFNQFTELKAREFEKIDFPQIVLTQ